MIDRETALVWSKMLPYKRLKQRTAENISQMLQVCKNPYIAFSCGKDSTVLADMILRANLMIPLRFVSSGETRLIHNVDDVMGYFRNTYHANIEEINFDRFSSDEWQGKSYDEVRASAHGDLKSLNRTTTFNGVFMGLRKDESRVRKMSLLLHQSEKLPKNMYKYADREFYRMCPLANWKTEDVGAYIMEHGIPFLNWYHDFGFDARTTRGVAPSRMSAPEARELSMLYIKVHNPAGYQRITERFPELML